jgi:hypothetical protein
MLEGVVPAESRSIFQVKLTADTAILPPGLQIVPFDITLDGKPFGELFDFLVQGNDSKQP